MKGCWLLGISLVLRRSAWFCGLRDGGHRLNTRTGYETTLTSAIGSYQRRRAGKHEVPVAPMLDCTSSAYTKGDLVTLALLPN